MSRSIHDVVSLAVVLGILLACAAVAHAEDPDCMSCHAGPHDPAKFKHLPIVDTGTWDASVHAKVACTKCHVGDGPGAFEKAPHRYDPKHPTPKCVDCHRKDFPDLIAEHEASVHATRIKTWHCGRCHDVHGMPKGQTKLPRAERNWWANNKCLRCHRETVYQVVGTDSSKLAHDWLPALKKHAKMRCVVCHTPAGEENEHNILPGSEATRDCAACHAEDTALLRKYVPAGDSPGKVTNPAILKDAYMPGAVRNRLVDDLILWATLLAIAGIGLHAGLRILTGLGRKRPPSVVHREYLYSISIRIWHWSNAALFVLLAVTGFRLHFGGRLGPWLSFETAYNVHCIAGWALVAVAIFFFAANSMTGNSRHYLEGHPAGFQGLLRQARWYVFGIFKGEPHPYHASKETKFNPMQRLAYFGVMYGLYPLLVLTGALLLLPDLIPDQLFGRPGSFWIATAHYLLGVCGTLFLIMHLYLATTGDRLGYLMSGMITGWHKSLVPADRESGEHEEA